MRFESGELCDVPTLSWKRQCVAEMCKHGELHQVQAFTDKSVSVTWRGCGHTVYQVSCVQTEMRPSPSRN